MYINDPWTTAQALASLHLSQVYLRPMQTMMQRDDVPRLIATADSDGRLPHGFRCHKLLQIYHTGVDKLDAMMADPTAGFSDWYNSAVIPILAGVTDELKTASIIRQRLIDSATQLKTLWLKWMGDVAKFPFLSFSLGGDYGSHFAFALLSTVILKDPSKFKLTDEQVQLGEAMASADCAEEGVLWRKRIEEHIKADVCTESSPATLRLFCDCKGKNIAPSKRKLCQGSEGSLRLLDHITKEPEFTTQLLQFATAAGSLLISAFPLLYNYAKVYIYSMQSDQQQTEGMFNKFDLSTSSHMSIKTAGASVMLMGLPSFVNVDADKRAEVTAQVKNRPRDYSRMSHISRVYGLHGEEKGAGLTRDKKPRSRACRTNQCKNTCQECTLCDECAVLYLSRGRNMHMWSKHPEKMVLDVAKELEAPLPPPSPPAFTATTTTTSTTSMTAAPMILMSMPRVSRPVVAVPTPAELAEMQPDGLDEDDGGDLFCYCQKEDDHRFMLACDKCDEWYHLDCLMEYRAVVISHEDAIAIDSYLCPECSPEQQPKQGDEEEEEEEEEEEDK